MKTSNSIPLSSVWGKLKPRVTHQDVVVISVGSNSFCVDKNDPYLKLLQPKIVKKTKVFVAVVPSKYLSPPGDEAYQCVKIAEVQITDSYKLVSRLQEFWRLPN